MIFSHTYDMQSAAPTQLCNLCFRSCSRIRVRFGSSYAATLQPYMTPRSDLSVTRLRAERDPTRSTAILVQLYYHLCPEKYVYTRGPWTTAERVDSAAIKAYDRPGLQSGKHSDAFAGTCGLLP